MSTYDHNVSTEVVGSSEVTVASPSLVADGNKETSSQMFDEELMFEPGDPKLKIQRHFERRHFVIR